MMIVAKTRTTIAVKTALKKPCGALEDFAR
jgi:hypothetical protein